jgi:diguanylate cyclase (GGDEF)-like protein/PAS domain S-box-containing protein
VEDEPLARRKLTGLLRRRFSQILVAEDGEAGLELFRRHRPLLVVTDLRMPRMDGIAMARAIKAEAPGTRIIFTTALDDAEFLLTAIEIGVTDYVLKPLAPARLFAAVDKCLQVQALEQALHTSRNQMEAILESIGDAFFVLDDDGRFTYLNQRATARFGRPREALLGAGFLAEFPGFTPDHQAFRTALADRRPRSFEHFSPDLNRWQEVRLFPLAGGTSVYLHDITESKLAEEKILKLALYDMLTGLPNRNMLQQRLTQAIQRRRRKDERCAVLFLDLDGFKTINDSLGHEAGDRVLVEVAKRLRNCIRDSDTAARLGGDEFILLLEGFRPPENIHSAAHRILMAVAEEIHHHDLSLNVTASIGISFFPEDGRTVEDLLKAADTAMYHGKKRGRNTYNFYRREMTAQTRHYLLMEQAMRKALQHKEFILNYQPQLRLETQELLGFEALIRWPHPKMGMIQPSDFIPLAEDTGFILQLGDWVLNQACRQGRAWLDQHPGPFRMAVNLSSRQFWQEDLVDAVARTLAVTGFPPGQLELEITESVIMNDVDNAIGKMRQLTDLGISLSIDDFGTGYSSLAALKRFPIQCLKIDKAFIKEVTVSANDVAIVTAIIALAHSMNLTVMAEGIETREQMDFLIGKGCETGQGYLFSPPVGPDQAARFLAEARPGLPA